jgi:hypothetical protein
LTDLGRRFEHFALYPDGEVVITVSEYDLGAIECRAKLTTGRMAGFKADVARTEVWRAKAARTVSAREKEGLSLNLEGVPPRDFQMTPAQWSKSPQTAALQTVLDRLLLDICGGDCPEPKARKRPEPSGYEPISVPVAPPRDPDAPKKP